MKYLISTVLLFFGLMAPVVFGQASPQETQGFDYASELRRLNSQYRSEVESYRQTERQYRIAVQQYQQLGTLASLEDAIKRTRETMISRNQVLSTYTALVRTTVAAQTGIDVNIKEELDIRLLSLEQDILGLNQSLPSDMTLEQLQLATEEFDSLEESMMENLYLSLSYISIGKVQSSYDKSKALLDEYQSIQEGEVNQNEITQIEASLDVVFEQIQVAISILNDNKRNPVSEYDDVTEVTQQAYDELEQVVGYFDEIIR